MEIKELKEHLLENGFEDSIVLEDPSYIDAVIGVTDDGNVCYSYNKMVQYMIDIYGTDYEEAIEYIDFNTERALPSLNSYGKRPFIIYDV